MFHDAATRSVIPMLAIAFLAGCAAVDRASTISAGAVNRYCVLSPEARAAVRNEISPYLNPGVAIRVDCP